MFKESMKNSVNAFDHLSLDSMFHLLPLYTYTYKESRRATTTVHWVRWNVKLPFYTIKNCVPFASHSCVRSFVHQNQTCLGLGAPGEAENVALLLLLLTTLTSASQYENFCSTFLFSIPMNRVREVTGYRHCTTLPTASTALARRR